MRVKECMSQAVVTISKHENLETAFEKMRQNHIHHLVVVEGPSVVGVLSYSDTGSEKIKPYTTTKGLLVADIMTETVVCAEPDTTIREAANLMRGNEIGCLPVLDNHHLVGIVTTTDLLDLLGQGAERVVGTTEKRPLSRENPGEKPAGFNPKLGRP